MILLAHSNFLAQDPKQQERMKPYAPLSTLLAAALLRSEAHEVAVFDATFASGVHEFEAMLDDLSPEIAVIMEDNFNFITKMCTTVRRETALSMIATARARGCRVAANGPDVSDNPALYFAAGADAVVLGEGEMALRDLVSSWVHGDGAIEAVEGLMIPEEGRLKRTHPRRALQDLDQLPHPAWDLIDADRYRQVWLGAHSEFSWNMATSRGCPYSCNWCAKPTFGRRYTVRSPEDVALEMRRLKTELRPDHLWFTDDILGLDLAWLRDFADEVQRLDAHIPFTMQSRVNLMTDKAVAALADAGARDVWLGVESGSQKILDAMEKGTTVEAARTATRTLKAHGVKACWFIQLGYPGEAWEDLLATRDLIRDEEPDDIGVSVAYPLPGTEFHERIRAQLGRQRNWKDTGDLAMLFQGTYDTAFYRRVRDVLHQEASGLVDGFEAWDAIERDAHLHRSPRPFRPAVNA